MSPAEVWAWLWIYLGMIVGSLSWILLMVLVYFDHKNKDKK